MNRVQFIERLKYLLQDIPEDERKDAIEYYENYFDEAGPEQEKSVIEELESPEKVAAIIRESVGYEESKTPDKKQLTVGKFHFKGERNRNLILLAFIFVGIITFALPHIMGVGGIALGFFGMIFGILVGILGMTVGFFVGGIGFIVYAIAHMFVNVPEGLLFLGGGCMAVAIGIFMIMLFIWIVSYLIPRFIQWFVGLFRKGDNIDEKVL